MKPIAEENPFDALPVEQRAEAETQAILSEARATGLLARIKHLEAALREDHHTLTCYAEESRQQKKALDDLHTDLEAKRIVLGADRQKYAAAIEALTAERNDLLEKYNAANEMVMKLDAAMIDDGMADRGIARIHAAVLRTFLAQETASRGNGADSVSYDAALGCLRAALKAAEATEPAAPQRAYVRLPADVLRTVLHGNDAELTHAACQEAQQALDQADAVDRLTRKIPA